MFNFVKFILLGFNSVKKVESPLERILDEQNRYERYLESFDNYRGQPPDDNRVSEVFTFGTEFIIAKTERGICFAYNRYTRKTLIINKKIDDNIIDAYLNKINQSILVIYANISDDFTSVLKCKSITYEQLKVGDVNGKELFSNFLL